MQLKGALTADEWEKEVIAHIKSLERSKEQPVPFYEIHAFILTCASLPNCGDLLRRVIDLMPRTEIVEMRFYQNALNSLGQMGKVHEALYLFKAMKDLKLASDSYILNALITACGVY